MTMRKRCGSLGPTVIYDQACRIITWQPKSRGHPLFATRGRTGQLCVLIPGNRHQIPSHTVDNA